MSSVFSNLKPVNHASRNGFDLSRRSVFSTKCGMVLPVFNQATLPDSEYSIDVKQLLRTQPLQTAAFTGFSVNYDFFFVPNNYSYSSFNEFISQRDDQRHVGQPSRSVIPSFSLKKFLNFLLPAAAYDYLLTERFSPTPTCYRVTDSEPLYFVGNPNFPWCSVSLEVVRALDMYGYGNFLPLVKVLAQQLYKFFSLQLDPATPNSFPDFRQAFSDFFAIISPSYEGDVFNDAELLNSTLYYILAGQYTNIPSGYIAVDSWVSKCLYELPDVKPTLWPALAYNKGWYEFYRSVYYDESWTLMFLDGRTGANFKMDYVYLYNFDDFDSSYTDSADWFLAGRQFIRLCAIFMPKYHLYKRDLLTGVLPSTQFGDVSMMVTDNDLRNLVGEAGNVGASVDSMRSVGVFTQNYGDFTVGIQNPQTGSLGTGKFRFDPALAISVLEQRRADAMQRFKERMLRAGNKVKDVFKAHGWSEPYSAHESSPIFLGTFDGRLDINTVAATSPSDGVELAQLGANGTAVVSGSKIRFKCHDFGTIIGVMYIVKDAEYDAYGVERQLCLTDPFDYPYPELQNISLFPIDILEASVYLRGQNDRDNSIVGYLPRYMEYKTALDKVHGEFHTAPIYSDDQGNDTFTVGGVFSDWVTPRRDINACRDVSFLYQSPMVADNIFLVEANELQSSDQFLVNCYFDVMAVEPVSVIGLPQ